MCYHRGIGFWNDLEDKPAQPWFEGAEEMYARFVGRLIPIRTGS